MQRQTDQRMSILRLTLLIVLGSWIVFSPAYRQLYGGKSYWFPRWVMFHGFGRNVCDVEFFQVTKRTGAKPMQSKIDRFEILGREKSWSTNKSLVRMNSKKDVLKVGTRLCEALGKGADVRATARCGSRDEWKSRLDTTVKLCKVRKRKGSSLGGDK